MKKIFFIVLTILIIGALAVYPLIVPEQVKESGGIVIKPVKFDFPENLHVIYGEKADINLTINSPSVEKLDLYFNDSLVKTWERPKGKAEFSLDPSIFGTGAYNLKLHADLSDEEPFEETRVVEVISDVVPEKMFAKVVEEYPHRQASFTQGLEFHRGKLYEGTGYKGQSELIQVDLESGEVKQEHRLAEQYFGEGITILDGKIYQLTWMENVCFVYGADSLNPIRQFNYSGEGWGLCNDGENLIMSDGSFRLYFRDPETFRVVRTIQVYNSNGAQLKLNELEYVDGMIYANIWMTNKIVVIEAKTGRVMQEIDGTQLMEVGRNGGDVLNGIAHQNGKFYFTGKYWTKLMEAKIIEAPDMAP